MRTGEILNAYMEGRSIMAQEIIGQAKYAPDLFDAESRLEYVIEWCKLELSRRDCTEKSATDIRHERDEQERINYEVESRR